MQIVIEVADTKADFVLELLGNLPFVAIQKDKFSTGGNQLESIQKSSPKTDQLLGIFPQLLNEAEARQQSILKKHA